MSPELITQPDNNYWQTAIKDIISQVKLENGDIKSVPHIPAQRLDIPNFLIPFAEAIELQLVAYKWHSESILLKPTIEIQLRNYVSDILLTPESILNLHDSIVNSLPKEFKEFICLYLDLYNSSEITKLAKEKGLRYCLLYEEGMENTILVGAPAINAMADSFPWFIELEAICNEGGQHSLGVLSQNKPSAYSSTVNLRLNCDVFSADLSEIDHTVEQLNINTMLVYKVLDGFAYWLTSYYNEISGY